MSKSNINEPFILATYTSTIRGGRIQRKLAGAYAAISLKSSNSLDNYVTVAVQGDGVHILDVSSLHPIISHTMGPTTFFTCPPLTLRGTSSSSMSTTYAVITASSELSSPEEGGRALWVWEDDTAKGKQGLKKSKIVLPPQQTVHTLFSHAELPGRIIILSTNGEVSLIDADSLEIKSTNKTSESPSSSSPSPFNATSVIQAFLLPSTHHSFFAAQNGTVLVVITSSGSPKTTQLRIYIISEGDSISYNQGSTIPVEPQKICSVSCSSSGCFTVLTVDGSWHSYQLSIKPESFPSPPPSPTQLSPPLALTGLSFLPTPNSSGSIDSPPASILALTSSHVLLAGISSSPSQEIVLLLWDVQFSVLLASHSLLIPSALSSPSSPSSLHIQLVLGPQTVTKTRTQVTGQVLLIVSCLPPPPSPPPPPPPGGPKKKKEKGEKEGEKTTSTAGFKLTTVLFVVPYSVPSNSTISAALGLGGVSEKWLLRGLEDESSSSRSKAETGRANLLKTIRSAVDGGQGQAAAAAFMKWTKDGGEEGEGEGVGEEGEDIDIDSDSIPAKQNPPFLPLEYNFVKELLNIVLLLRIQQQQPTSKLTATTATKAYSPEIIRYLLEHQAICSAMIETPGGLLGALRARGDWDSIELAFNVVLDLKESEIIETLQFIISQHRQSSVSDDAMQVDTPVTAPSSSPSATTPLPTFLNLSIMYPTSHAPLVSTVRKQLRDAEDLTVLLEILDEWLTQRITMEEPLLPGEKDLKRTEYGVWTVVGKTAEKGKGKKLEDVPPLDKIINFIQLILDASFFSLLNYKKAHQVLQHINTQINPEIAFAKMIESLRGSLEPFAIAQEKAIKESMIPEKEKEKERQKVDWRQRRKRFDGDVGVYQLEELVL